VPTHTVQTSERPALTLVSRAMTVSNEPMSGASGQTHFVSRSDGLTPRKPGMLLDQAPMSIRACEAHVYQFDQERHITWLHFNTDPFSFLHTLTADEAEQLGRALLNASAAARAAEKGLA